MNHDPRDLEWQRRYDQNDVPWDKGAPSPALTDFLAVERIAGRILVPGCGRGHEARALAAQPDTTVLGLDLSTTAIAQAQQLSSNLHSNLSFAQGDFLHLPLELRSSFDWVVEHTCFCALEPRQRSEYALAAASALQAGGRIFGIFYPDPDTESGPPFAISADELDELFSSHFVALKEWVPANSFAGREGRELVRIMQKR